MREIKKFIGVIEFDTITSLKEFSQIMHFFLSNGYEITIEIEKELEGKIYPEGSNLQYIITKKSYEKVINDPH
jgi:hypothetical protein